MPVYADGVEAGSPPLPSSLGHGASLVAETILSRPELRSASAIELARLLGVSVGEAREGAAAVVHLADRVGRRVGFPLLSAPPAQLVRDMGLFMSVDAALARFASHGAAPVNDSRARYHTVYGTAAGLSEDPPVPTHDAGPTTPTQDAPPAPPPPPAPTPPSADAPPATSDGSAWLWILGLGAAAYLVLRKKGRK